MKQRESRGRDNGGNSIFDSIGRPLDGAMNTIDNAVNSIAYTIGNIGRKRE